MLYTGTGQIVHLCLRASANQEPRQEQQPALAASRLESEPTGTSSGEGKYGMGKRRERSEREKDLPIRDVNPFMLGHADAAPSSKVLKWFKNLKTKKISVQSNLRERTIQLNKLFGTEELL